MAFSRPRGFTLIELIVAIAIAGILLALAAPSFYDFILLQRLKGVSSQMVTDMQFARSEAASRNVYVRVRFSNNLDKTCYVLFTGASPNVCSCLNTPVCSVAGGGKEIRTVNVNRQDSILLHPRMNGLAELAYDPATGAIVTGSLDLTGAPPTQFVVDSCIGPIGTPNCGGPAPIPELEKRLRLEIKLSGRPGLCSPPVTSIRLSPC